VIPEVGHGEVKEYIIEVRDVTARLLGNVMVLL
jgi:hypothetical protein